MLLKTVVLISTLAAINYQSQASTPLAIGTAVYLTNVSLTGPSVICNGESATYTLTLQGTGESLIAQLRWSVYDVDSFIVDNVLVDETLIQGFTPDAGALTWTREETFVLTCSGGNINGINGGSDGNPAQVYVLLEGFFGGDIARSNTLNVECVPCPEASSIGSMSLAILALGALKLRRTSRAPAQEARQYLTLP